MPDSSPRLPGEGAKKHAAFRRLNGCVEGVYGSQPLTTPMLAPSVFDPVSTWFNVPPLRPETLNPGVNGDPDCTCVTPESCQSFVNSLVTRLPNLKRGVLYT